MASYGYIGKLSGKNVLWRDDIDLTEHTGHTTQFSADWS